MPADRFFIPSPLKGPIVTLTGEEFHHLAKVMRVRIGETIELVNGRGELAEAEVVSLNKTAELKILSHHTSPPPAQAVILAQALTRPSSLEWIVEKGTELGTTEFWFFPSDQSEKKDLSPTQLQRLATISINALKQCGRLYLPKIVLKPSLENWEKPSGSLFFGDLSSQTPLKGPFEKTVVFFIGPEKGFSPEETKLLTQFKAQGISLHENILRAETAAITLLSQFYFISRS